MSDIETKVKDSKAAKFFKGVKAEFKKIIWPERDTLLKQLAVVLAVAVVVGLLIAVIDFGAQNLIDLVVRLGE